MRTIVLTMLICVLTVTSVKAEILSYYYQSYTDDETVEWVQKDVEFIGFDNYARMIYYLFFTMMIDEEVQNFPKGRLLKHVRLADGELTLNFDKRFLDYGGNAFEEAMVSQLTKTALSLPKVKTLSVLIEGEQVPLKEGREVNKFSR